MDSGMNIQVFDVSKLKPSDDYVIINVDITKLPASVARQRLAEVRESEMCKMLDNKKINYTIVGCRNGAAALSLNVDRLTEKHKYQAFDDSMKTVEDNAVEE